MNKQPNILVVDDDEDLLQLLQMYMKPPEYRLSVATDGKTALQLIEQEKPDVVLLDLMMPGTNGFAVCRKIKANPHLKDVKVIILTQADTPDNRRKAEALGADKFMPKGADKFDLIKSIEVLLNRL